MTWVQIGRKTHVRDSKNPFVSLGQGKNPQALFSKKAAEIMGNPRYLHVFFDGDTKRIGMIPMDEPDASTKTVSQCRTSFYFSARSVQAAIGSLYPPEKTSYGIERDGNMFVIDLTKPLEKP